MFGLGKELDLSDLYFKILTHDQNNSTELQIKSYYAGNIFKKYIFKLSEIVEIKGYLYPSFAREYITINDIESLFNVKLDIIKYNIKTKMNGNIYFKTKNELLTFEKYIESLMVFQKIMQG